MTCASSSFSPLAGVDVATAGIFLADEGRDVGVEDLGVVELDLDAPTADKSYFFNQKEKTSNTKETKSITHCVLSDLGRT